MAGDDPPESVPTTEEPAVKLDEEEEERPHHFLHHVDSCKIMASEDYAKEHFPHHPHPPSRLSVEGLDGAPAGEDGTESPPANPGRLQHCDSAVLTRKHLAEHSPDPNKPTSFRVGQRESPGGEGSDGNGSDPEIGSKRELHHVDSAVLIRQHPPHHTPSRLGTSQYKLGHPGLVEANAGDGEAAQEEEEEPGEDATSEAPAAEGEAARPMSKNQQKKLAKKQRLAEVKAAKRAAEKAKQREEAEARRAENRAKLESMTEEERQAYQEQARAKKAERRAGQDARKERLKGALESGQRLVIDLDFEDKMTETEIRSLCQQLLYSYSANTRAEKPFHLRLSSFKGHLESTMRRQAPAMDNWYISKDAACYTETFRDCKEDIVYLTADSPNTLSELDPSKVYIIGGIVDRNRHKNICLERAEAAGVATAALPIGPHLKLTGSKVLTVNQVVEIMLRYSECKDWKQALLTVVPERKRGQDSEGSEAQPPAKQQKTAS